MPRTGVYTSPEERQRIRQSYYAASEKEAGVAHLWHLQQLADIRFSPNHTIQDVPEVDFHSTASPADDYRDLFAQRYAQQVQHDEARLHEENKMVYRNIVLASDDEARRARHMNLVPTEDQVRRFDNIQQQTLHRTQDRERRQRVVAEQNKRLLDHLVSVPPHVRSTKELDTWYHNVHKRRVAQLSRFKPAERYAGERVLEGTAAYAASARRANARDGGDRRGTQHGSTQPLVRGQPYPPPTAAEVARRAPSSLKPAAASTTYNGVPVSRLSDSTTSRPPQRPEWQPIAATDIPLLHYTADQQLRGRTNATGNVASGGGSQRGRSASSTRSSSPAQRELFPTSTSTSPGATHPRSASHTQHPYLTAADAADGAAGRHGDNHHAAGVRRVTAQEEGGVTQLWRRAVEDRHGSGNNSNNGNNGNQHQKDSTPNRKQVRTVAVHKGGDGDPEAEDGMADASPIPPQAPQRHQQSSPSTNSGDGQQRRLSKKRSKPASTRPPLPAARSTPAVGSSSGSDDNDEAASLKSLMEGWSKRSESSARAYAPL